MNFYEQIFSRGRATGEGMTHFERLFAAKFGGSPAPKVREYTGAVPVTITADGTPLLDYLISGNTTQSGTPTPDNPIMPQGTGERTENLFDKNAVNVNNGYITNGFLLSDGSITTNIDYRASEYIRIAQNQSYTLFYGSNLNLPSVCFYDSAKNYISGIAYAGRRDVHFTTPQNAEYLRLSFRAVDPSRIMLNTGSTPLPYEPHGIEIPISSGGNNLFDGNYVNAYLTPEGIYTYPDYTTKSIIVKCDPNITYTIKQIADVSVTHKWRIAVFNSMPTNNAQGTILVIDDSLSESTITTANDSAYIVVYYMYAGSPYNVEFMINLGTTALPYEPYNRTTTPVYLGEVETTRRIRKLVLTGEENITSGHLDISLFNIPIDDYIREPIISLICTHYIAQQNVDSSDKVSNKNTCFYVGTVVEFRQLYIRDTSYSTIADFKSYLTQQYAAGTPVCVWYVLASETTGIVNEPLMRIGDYADTLSKEQSGVAIPTNNGSTTIDVDTEVKPSEVYIKYMGR